MYKYRITKYNPLFREANGRYTKEDWTSISDIGKKFEGNVLATKDYKSTEDKYVKAVQLIMDYMTTPFVIVTNVRKSTDDADFEETIRKYPELYKEIYLMDTYHNITDTMKFSTEKVDSLVRLLLREEIGAEVFYDTKLKIFIGYDFLMGIHVSKPIDPVVPSIKKMGLFVEKY